MESTQKDESTQHVEPRRKTLNGGVDPSAAGKRSAEARRERAAARQAAQEHDRLTVQARLALALAEKLDYKRLQEVIDATIAQARTADGHVQIQAARTVLAWAELAAAGGEDDTVPEGGDLAAMTPEQRAVYRSVRERALQEMEQLASDPPGDGA